MAHKHHPFRFVIAGRGSPNYEAAILQQLETAGLRDRTQLVGFVSREFKDLLLQGSDLFVLSSHSENFGLAILEALSAGLPVLTSPGVALSSIVQQEELGWVTPLNSESLNQAFQQFFANPQAARSMGERAHQIVQQHYSWSAIAAQLCDRYREALKI
jgi:glycosyltransferase involved in cell wall biosynthesis